MSACRPLRELGTKHDTRNQPKNHTHVSAASTKTMQARPTAKFSSFADFLVTSFYNLRVPSLDKRLVQTLWSKNIEGVKITRGFSKLYLVHHPLFKPNFAVQCPFFQKLIISQDISKTIHNVPFQQIYPNLNPVNKF